MTTNIHKNVLKCVKNVLKMLSESKFYNKNFTSLSRFTPLQAYVVYIITI